MCIEAVVRVDAKASVIAASCNGRNGGMELIHEVSKIACLLNGEKAPCMLLAFSAGAWRRRCVPACRSPVLIIIADSIDINSSFMQVTISPRVCSFLL